MLSKSRQCKAILGGRGHEVACEYLSVENMAVSSYANVFDVSRNDLRNHFDNHGPPPNVSRVDDVEFGIHLLKDGDSWTTYWAGENAKQAAENFSTESAALDSVFNWLLRIAGTGTYEDPSCKYPKLSKRLLETPPTLLTHEWVSEAWDYDESYYQWLNSYWSTAVRPPKPERKHEAVDVSCRVAKRKFPMSLIYNRKYLESVLPSVWKSFTESFLPRVRKKKADFPDDFSCKAIGITVPNQQIDLDTRWRMSVETHPYADVEVRVIGTTIDSMRLSVH